VLSLANLLHQTIVAARTDGSLTISSLLRADGSPKRWVPIGHDLFAEEDRGTRLELLRDPSGAVSGFATDLLPVLQYERASPWLSAGIPALGVALLILVITAASLPWGWLLRRRNGIHRSSTSRARTVFKLARIGAWLPVMALVGWGLVIVSFLSDYTLISERASALLTTMRFLTVAATVAAGLLIFDGVAAWRDQERRLAHRLGAGVIAIAAAAFVLFVGAFGLITFSLMY
jgi:hypothetical protein